VLPSGAAAPLEASGVRGSVLKPPCIRHRCFPLTAGAEQAWPQRVRAPQRGALCVGFIDSIVSALDY